MTDPVYPTNVKYYPDGHLWVRLEGDHAVVGVTDFGQQQELGDLTGVELPGAVGRRVNAGDSVGTLEAAKAILDIYSPLAGEITEVNKGLVGPTGDPSGINERPYETWLFKLRTDPKNLEGLVDAEKYRAKCEQQ